MDSVKLKHTFFTACNLAEFRGSTSAPEEDFPVQLWPLRSFCEKIAKTRFLAKFPFPVLEFKIFCLTSGGRRSSKCVLHYCSAVRLLPSIGTLVPESTANLGAHRPSFHAMLRLLDSV